MLGMDKDEYRAALKRLGLTQVSAARFFDVHEMTSRRWANGSAVVPGPVAKLLRLMAQMEFTVEYVDRQIERWERE
jgi:DNA-binding transcriptional regulator YiaG